MAEVWKPVPSLPGVLASSEGRLRFPARTITYANGNSRTYATKPVLGYVRFARKGAAHHYLGIYNKKYGNIKIHRAVCEAFHGPAPFEGAVVLHLDECSLNNQAENLRWGTQKENLNAPGFIAACAERTSNRDYEKGVGGFKRKAV